jgi:hypothetical protein
MLHPDGTSTNMKEPYCLDCGSNKIALPSQGGSRGVEDIAAERARQVSAEGWTPEHDDEHDAGELASAAACYAVNAACQIHPYDGNGAEVGDLPWWPWDKSWWKPRDARRDLVRAGALIAAEIDRLDRATKAENRQGSV